MGLIQSIEGMNRTKKLSKKRFSFCSPVFEQVHRSPPVSGLGLRLKLVSLGILILKPLNSDKKYIIGSSGPPACQMKILRLLSFHNYMSQFLMICRDVGDDR